MQLLCWTVLGDRDSHVAVTVLDDRDSNVAVTVLDDRDSHGTDPLCIHTHHTNRMTARCRTAKPTLHPQTAELHCTYRLAVTYQT